MRKRPRKSAEFRKRADAYLAAFDGLHLLNDDELADLLRSCATMTEVNCGWAEFQTAQLLMEQIGHERRRRERARVKP